MAELSQRFDVHPNQITQRKTQLLERSTDVLSDEPKELPVGEKTLHTKIGDLTLENDFLERALTKTGLLRERK